MRVMTVLLLLATTTTHAETVNLAGFEWRQPSETAGVEPYDVFFACSPVTGVCGGEYAGWIWASLDDVVELFAVLTPIDAAYQNVAEANSTWAPLFLSYFDATYTDPNLTDLAAATRTSAIPIDLESEIPAWVVTASVRDYIDPNTEDTANTRALHQTSNSFPSVGLWMYRDVSVVPLPAGVWLVVSGIGFLTAMRRMRR